jgi:hypothetical protein
MDITPPIPLETLKEWFRTFNKPTQEQFWAWMHSFWHKSEKVPASSIDGLAPVATGGALDAGKVGGLATVAKSGRYSDLTGTPDIPQGYTPAITVGSTLPTVAGSDGDIFILLKNN